MSIAIDLLETRRPFLSMLHTYRQTAYPEEETTLEEIAQLVVNDPNCFDRVKREGAQHIAASVFLMSRDLKKALFMWHTLIGHWTQPGGHADGNPNIQEVAKRELEEETGVIVTDLLDSIPFEIFRYDFPRNVFGYEKSIINCFFMAALPDGQQPRIVEPDKCGELRWATPNEARELIRKNPHVGYERLFKKWEARISAKRLRA